ncbi:MAG: hypothetical protein WA057_02875 [Candidatus Magasanikiibacteriota bacterium]
MPDRIEKTILGYPEAETDEFQGTETGTFVDEIEFFPNPTEIARAKRYKEILKERLEPFGFQVDNVDIHFFKRDIKSAIRGVSRTFSRIILLPLGLNPDSSLGINTVLHEYVHLEDKTPFTLETEKHPQFKKTCERGKKYLNFLVRENRKIQPKKVREMVDSLYGITKSCREHKQKMNVFFNQVGEDPIGEDFEILCSYDYESYLLAQSESEGDVQFLTREEYMSKRKEQKAFAVLLASDKVDAQTNMPNPLSEGFATYMSCTIQGITIDEFKEMDKGVCHPSYFTYAHKFEQVFGKDWQSALSFVRDSKTADDPFKVLADKVGADF